jgi:hypothetical protein
MSLCERLDVCVALSAAETPDLRPPLSGKIEVLHGARNIRAILSDDLGLPEDGEDA